LVGLDKSADLPNASSLCGACKEVCPIKINIPHMLLNLRSKLAEGHKSHKVKRKFSERIFAKSFRFIMSSPFILGLIHKIGRCLQIPFVKNGKIARLRIPPFSTWTNTKDLPPIAKQSFRDIWKKKLSKENNNGNK
jgi:L-lactate dehydrogenase complex protein LldF